MRKKSVSTRIAAALAIAFITIPLAACASSQSGAERSTVAMSGADSAMLADQSAAGVESISSVVDSGRSIISNGSISLTVDNVQAAAADVSRIATELNGYVESQNLGNQGARSESADYASFTLRIPADRFDAALEQLGELGNVTDESKSASDVTAQHVDLQARVEALQASVDRLTELMAGAATTSELIEAESALSQRQAELDGLRAQLEALENQVNEATIWVSVSTNQVIVGGPANFWEGLLAGLNSLSVAAAGAIVLFGVLLPWLLVAAVIAVVVVAIVRTTKRRRARRTEHAAQATLADTTAAAPHAVAPNAQTQAGAESPATPGE